MEEEEVVADKEEEAPVVDTKEATPEKNRAVRSTRTKGKDKKKKK